MQSAHKECPILPNGVVIVFEIRFSGYYFLIEKENLYRSSIWVRRENK